MILDDYLFKQIGLELALLSHLDNEMSLRSLNEFLETGKKDYTCYLMNLFITRILCTDIKKYVPISEYGIQQIDTKSIKYDIFISNNFEIGFNYVFNLDSHAFNVIYISDTQIYLVDYYMETKREDIFRIKKFTEKEEAIKNFRCFFEKIENNDMYSYANVFGYDLNSNDEEVISELELLKQDGGLSNGSNVLKYKIINNNIQLVDIIQNLQYSREKFIEQLEYICKYKFYENLNEKEDKILIDLKLKLENINSNYTNTDKSKQVFENYNKLPFIENYDTESEISDSEISYNETESETLFNKLPFIKPYYILQEKELTYSQILFIYKLYTELEFENLISNRDEKIIGESVLDDYMFNLNENTIIENGRIHNKLIDEFKNKYDNRLFKLV